MTVEELKQLISIYIDGQATPEQEDIVLHALKDSDALRSYYQDLLALSASLQEWPEENLSPDLEQTIHHVISKQEKTKMKKSTVIPIGATIAVAVMVLVIGQQYSQRAIQGHVRQATENLKDQKLSVETSQPATQSVHTQAATQSAPATSGYLTKTSARTKSIEQNTTTQMDGIIATDAAYDFGQEKMVVAEYKAERVQPMASGLVFLEDVMVPPVYNGRPADDFNTEQYDLIAENEFLSVVDHPLSTFSIDVDTASYANLRRFLNNGQMPPIDAVRIEEMINYFTYDYPQPQGDEPFSVNIEVGACPWNAKHQLALIGLQGRSLDVNTIPQSNFVFLIDVSGSMNDANKLPLLKQGFKMMVQQLRPEEKVSIVTYAGQAGVLLDSVAGDNKQQIIAAIDRLQSSGSTAGAQGILTAYELAKKNLIPGGNNRVILATDGDFNIGVSSDSELVRIIEEKRNQGIFLTVLGFGMGNYKDGRMEKLADKGNGNYYYIDTEREAKKVMVRELGSTLFTIAKDVKLQIEFNPQQVAAYRLVGYENRKLNKEDFNNDAKDAGELGAGHTVTAFYEIIPAGTEETIGTTVDPLKYQIPSNPVAGIPSDEMMTVKLRYKQPHEDVSQLISRAVTASDITMAQSQNYQWASSVAEFGMLLRQSQFKKDASFANALTRARSAKGADEYGYRQEFIELVEKAQTLAPETYSTGYGFKSEK